MARVSWWVGSGVDHLYPNCPGRMRSLPVLRKTRLDIQGAGTVDPEGTDICGICVRWWRARNRGD